MNRISSLIKRTIRRVKKQTFEQKLHVLEEEIQELNDAFPNFETEIKKLEEHLPNLTISIKNRKKKLNEIEIEQQKFKHKVHKRSKLVKPEFLQFTEELKKIESQISNANNIKQIENELKKLKDNQNDIKRNLQKLKDNLKNQETNLQKLKDEPQTFKDSLQSLKTKIPSYENNIQTIKTKIPEQENKIRNLENKIQNLEPHIQTTENTIQTATNQIQNLNLEIQKIKEKLTTLKNDIKTFEKRVKENSTIKTLDGKLVQSNGEKRICNFLYRNEIPYKYDSLIRINKQYVRPDFILKNRTVIEYWGMEGDPEYDKKRERKTKIYQEGNLRLIDVNRNTDIEKHLAEEIFK